MTHRHMVGALNNALDILMEKHDNTVLLGEDIGLDGGVFRVTDGLQDKYGSNRVADTPLAEAGIIGGSIGLAINGMRPIPEMQFSGFSYQAFHQFKQHMARFRQRSNGGIELPVTVRAPCSGGIRALEHHSESPETFFIHTQGLHVVMPSTPTNAKGLLISAVESNDPVIFLEPKKIYRSFKEDVQDDYYNIELGKAEVVEEGTDLTLITYGAMRKVAQDTLEDIESKGVSAELIDLQTLWPLDTETILESVRRTGRAIVLHEAQKTLGFGAEISSRIHEEAILALQAPVKRVTAPDVPYPQFALEKYYLPNKKRLLNAVDEVMNF